MATKSTKTPAPAPAPDAAAPATYVLQAGGRDGVPIHTDPDTMPLSYLESAQHQDGQGNLGLQWDGSTIDVPRAPSKTREFYLTLLGAGRFLTRRKHDHTVAAHAAARGPLFSTLRPAVAAQAKPATTTAPVTQAQTTPTTAPATT